MTLDVVVIAIVAGVLAGWLAGIVMKDGGYGGTGDILLGLGGSLVAIGLVRAFGPPPAASFGTTVIGFIGATVAIAAQRKLWQAHA